MPITFAFTYSTITPESAEQGDHEDHGFLVYPWNFRYSMNDAKTCADIMANPDDYRTPWKPGELRYILNQAENLGIWQNEGADWLHSEYSIEDYTTAEEIQHCLHVDGVTPSTLDRITRLLNGDDPIFPEGKKTNE